jgi:hypothetical protein
MTYKLEITINGSNPSETIATLEDLVYFLDNMASIFSSKQIISEDDVPIMITYQGEHNFDPVTSLPLLSKLVLSHVGWKNTEHTFLTNPEFKIGELVHHVYTGTLFVIKASVYYHLNKTFTYLVTPILDPTKSKPEMYTSEQLMTQALWDEIPTMLWNITGNSWYWNEFQRVFESTSIKYRKMRPLDAIEQWKMNFEGQKVPF